MEDLAAADLPDPEMQPKTLEYLERGAAEAFKRQADADEAIWRSLPLFGAALGLALAFLGRLADGTAGHYRDGFEASTNVLLVLAALAFVWAFRWFWSVVAPRDYQAPADVGEVIAYADGLTFYYGSTGLSGEALDNAVMHDMRVYMMDQLADAARHNLGHNDIRFLARGQAMTWTLIGFALAFVCAIIMFIHTSQAPTPSRAGARKNVAAAYTNATPFLKGPEPSNAAAADLHHEGSDARKDYVDPGCAGGQEVTDKKPAPPKPTPPPLTTQRRDSGEQASVPRSKPKA